MKYKLKDFVTDEMLVECGFIKGIFSPMFHNPFRYKNLEWLIMFNPKTREVRCLTKDGIDVDIIDWAKEYIDKGYVEVVE